MKRMIHAVVADLDGTLITSGRNIGEKDAEAAEALRRNGVGLVIATGRHINFIRPYVEKLGAGNVSCIVSLSGACLIDAADMHPWSVGHIFGGDTENFLRYVSMGGYPYTVYTEKMAYYRRDDHRLADRNSVFYCEGEPLFHYGTDYRYADEIDGAERALAVKLTVTRVPAGRLGGFRKLFGGLSLCIYERKNGTFDCEMQPKGVGKLTGLLEAGKRYGFTMDGALAIGDSNNDVDMLSASGYAAIPSNAELLDGGAAFADNSTVRLMGRKVFITADNDSNPLAAAVAHFAPLIF